MTPQSIAAIREAAEKGKAFFAEDMLRVLDRLESAERVVEAAKVFRDTCSYHDGVGCGCDWCIGLCVVDDALEAAHSGREKENG